jgi:YfiH family protein
MDLYKFKCFEKYSNLLSVVTKKSMIYPYDFSMALHTGEDENKIVKNREEIAASFKSDIDLHFVVANQTHSDNIVIVNKHETKGWRSAKDAVEDCDALITKEKGMVLTILTADCVPILLYDPKKEVIAAVHAGWKGTKNKIVAKTVQKMQDEFACDAANIVAAIAPSIGKCCYEVGEDVAKHFFDTKDAFSKNANKYMLDLPYINKYQLLEAKIKDENIEMSGICTSCEVHSYFSYRKEQGCSGRFMSMIGML